MTAAASTWEPGDLVIRVVDDEIDGSCVLVERGTAGWWVSDGEFLPDSWISLPTLDAGWKHIPKADVLALVANRTEPRLTDRVKPGDTVTHHRYGTAEIDCRGEALGSPGWLLVGGGIIFDPLLDSDGWTLANRTAPPADIGDNIVRANEEMGQEIQRLWAELEARDELIRGANAGWMTRAEADMLQSIVEPAPADPVTPVSMSPLVDTAKHPVGLSVSTDPVTFPIEDAAALQPGDVVLFDRSGVMKGRQRTLATWDHDRWWMTNDLSITGDFLRSNAVLVGGPSHTARLAEVKP